MTRGAEENFGIHERAENPIMAVGWVFGVVVGCCATAFAGLGDNLVKLSYNTVIKKNLDVKNRWTKEGCLGPFCWVNTVFVAGWLSTLVLNTALNSVALSLAPASIVMPLAALHLVFGVWFAW